MRFEECETCKSKSGSPTLCAGCQNNRDVIAKLIRHTVDKSLTFGVVSAVNITRSNIWHPPGKNWSLLEWAGAMCGEAGETANVAKKIRRIEMGLVTPKLTTMSKQGSREILIRTQLAKEIGDTFLYLDLLATKAGLRLEDCVRQSFNDKSEELGFPQRIP